MNLLKKKSIAKEKIEEESKKHFKEGEESLFWKPARIIGSLVLALLLILMIIPIYNIKLDPEPKQIPLIKDVFNQKEAELLLQKSNKTGIPKRSMNIASYLSLESPELDIIKQTATKISTYGCKESRVCYAKAIFYFVRDRFNYVNDPFAREYFQSALETLTVKGGDCDDLTILTANLMRAIGINTRFVLVSGHVFLQIHLKEAIKSYKDKKTDWINIDPTCRSCDFGKLSLETANKEKVYIG